VFVRVWGGGGRGGGGGGGGGGREKGLLFGACRSETSGWKDKTFGITFQCTPRRSLPHRLIISLFDKVNSSKVHTRSPRRRVEEQLYSFFNLGARCGWVVTGTPRAALSPRMPLYPLYRRLLEPRGRSEQVRKISPPPEFDPPTVQPVASHYTDWAITAHIR